MKESMTSPLISEVQNIVFAQEASATINGVDLNVNGFSINNEDPSQQFVLDGQDAVRNKVMFWLYSDRGDYVRESFKGGPLTALLGKRLAEDSAGDIERSLRSSFEEVFGADLTLTTLLVIPNSIEKRWDLTMYVLDPIRRDLFKLALGVAA